jgi:phage terminase large subunit-like protein
VVPSCGSCGWSPEPGELWPSEGAIGVTWIEDNLIFGEGDFYGQPFRLRVDQKRFIYQWLEHCGNCGWWRYTEGLRGAATGDGKTQFVAAIVALEFAGPEQYVGEDGKVHGIAPRSPNIPIAAASFEQADLLYGAFAIMMGGRDNHVKEAPLCGFFEVYDTRTTFTDGKPGVVHRVAAVAGTNEGGLPHLFVRDELHEWGDVGDRKARVGTVIGKSANKRQTLRGPGRVLSLSTAGFDEDHSLLGAICKQGRKTLVDPTSHPTLLYDWQEAPEGLDYNIRAHRETAVRAASAAAGIQWPVSSRVDAWGSPDMPSHEWIRYYANRWVDVGSDSWLKEHPGAWKQCEGAWESDPEENPWVLAVDMALNQDSVAVDRIELLPDGRVSVKAKIFRAQDTAQKRVNHAEVWEYIRGEIHGLGFRGVVYDPRFFELPARMLEDDGIMTIQFDQSPQRMAPACGEAYRRILENSLVHRGDPDLNSHVLSAAKKPQERGGFTLSKGRSKRHIDACVAMVMGIWVLLEVPEEEEVLPWVDFM